MRFLIAIFVFIFLFSPVSNAISVANGETAPDFTLSSVKGKMVSLQEERGKVVVLIYWRTGHKRSLQALNDSKDILESLKSKDVEILSVIADSDSTDEVEKILSDNKINFPVVVDRERQLYSSYGIRVYPTTMIIDKKGVISYTIPSHPLSYKKLLKGHIKKTLGEISDKELEESLSSHKEKVDDATLEAMREYNLSMKFVKSGLIDMAINMAQKSVKAKPDMLKSHILLGFLYLDTDEPDKALETFNKALELDPKSNDAKTGLGGALISKGEVDKAIEILTPAAVANPYPQMTYYELGKAYEIKGHKDLSIKMYKKAVEKIIHKQILPSSISKCK